MIDDTEHTALLRAIHDQQGQQLHLQTEALELQREHFALARAQLERAGSLHDRAEAMQSRAARTGRIAMWLALPALALILLLVLWSVFAELAWS